MKGTTTSTLPETAKEVLKAVVGSTAYGLATEDSDVDYRGCFVLPTHKILGVFPLKDTVQKNDPDICEYELTKFVKLCAQANPSVLEMLFLEEYEVLLPEGQMLIDIRDAFVSQYVADRYGGYAMAQLKRLLNRGDGSFSADTRKRYSKHARHCFRLIRQGNELLTTGTLNVRVKDPENLFWIGEQEPEKLKELFEQEFYLLDQNKVKLPEKPDLERINKVVLAIREMNAQ